MGQGYKIGCTKCLKEKERSIHRSEKINGTYFDISTGGGMLCFCKEQVEKHYGVNKKYNRKYRLLAGGDPPDEVYSISNSPINEENINSEILENIKNGYNFTKYLGSLPYYCEACKTLENYFYFQMEKNGIHYIPDYRCKLCNGNLKPVCPTWEKDDEGSWADTLGNIKFELYMYENNKIITIKYENEEKHLVCKYCNNNKFSLLLQYLYD